MLREATDLRRRARGLFRAQGWVRPEVHCTPLLVGFHSFEVQGHRIWAEWYSSKRAAIGLAPILLNPSALLLVTALLTPLTFQEVAKPSVGVVAEGIFASGFLTYTPLLAAVWVYLSLSFALGSVPSREDLSGLPMVLLVFGGGILLIVLLRMGLERVLSSAVYDLSALAAGLYALPATVAAVAAALTMGLGGRTIRH